MTTTAAHRRSRLAAMVPAEVRVAIYARKSTDKGLDNEYTTLDNQVQTVAAYVASQRAQGWVALPEPYTDGGFSGATTERPAFQRLLADVRAGRVNVIAVARLDRLSRSVRDFIDLLALFEQHNVQFVSITEHFDTTTPMGRFTLGIFMHVAQLEREVIADRIRTKMRGARKLGKWQGGRPVLGYAVENKRLIVVPDEARDVVSIFEIFARTTSIVATLRELEARGIRLKSWTTQRGRKNEGRVFRDHSLRVLLRNPLYVSKMYAGEEIVAAEHPRIVEQDLFDEVQALLAGGRRQQEPRQPWSAILTGLIHCAVCGSGMTPSYCTKGNKRYGFYVCQRIKDHGAAACPGSRISQATVETAVVERIKALAHDPALLAEAVRAAHTEVEARRREQTAHAQRAGTEVARLEAAINGLVGADGPEALRRLNELSDARDAAAQRATEAKDAAARLRGSVDEAALRRAIESFTPAWDALFPAERARLLRLLIDRATIDGRTDRLDITLLPGGVAELAGSTPISQRK